jgi:hypothetical protein
LLVWIPEDVWYPARSSVTPCPSILASLSHRAGFIRHYYKDVTQRKNVTEMDEHDDWLAQHFEEHRTHLRAVAYRMLGSISEDLPPKEGIRGARMRAEGPQ